MFWKSFPKHKPKEDGWYLCSITFEFSPGRAQSYVMDLYWYSDRQKFIDNRRQHIFDTYNVLSCDGTVMHTEKSLCDRTAEVTGWRKVPKYYVKGAKRKFKRCNVYKFRKEQKI